MLIIQSLKKENQVSTEEKWVQKRDRTIKKKIKSKKWKSVRFIEKNTKKTVDILKLSILFIKM